MSFTADIETLMGDVARQIDLPAVREILVPKRESNPCKDAEFALIMLEDGSAGFFYVWLGDTLQRLGGLHASDFIGCDPLLLIEKLTDQRPEQRALALGAVNAVSQHVMRRAGLTLSAAGSMGELSFGPEDHVGMVGLFPSLARRLAERGVALSVVEKRPHLLDASSGFSVSLDPAVLATCNQVLITGSTLLNDTLDEILTHCQSAEHVALIGPTASCLPDLLFERGVHAVGGSVVLELESLRVRLGEDGGWGNAVQKYVLRRDDYPGVEALLSKIRPPQGA